MIRAFNLASDQIMEFDNETTPEWSVRYAWADENQMLSCLLGFRQDNRQDLIDRVFPIVEGNISVSLGDWCSLKVNSQ